MRCHFDRLILWYLAIIFLLTFFGSYFGFYYLLAAMLHLVLIMMLFRITAVRRRTGPRALLRWFYPLLMLLPLHYEIELVGTLFHAGSVYDDLVRVWDRVLFGGHPHLFLVKLLPGPFWRELFHFFYLAYYPLVVLGFVASWRKDHQDTAPAAGSGRPIFFPRFAFVFMGSFVTYMAIFILFPVVGPLDDRFLRFHGQGLLGPLIDLIYTVGDSAGGALPSSHIGLAIVIYLLLQPAKHWQRSLFIATILGLTVGAVYGAFHYGIDAVGGIVTGVLFYYLWDWNYRRLSEESIQPVPSPTE